MQKEVKFILFTPTEGHFAVDIYVVHEGQPEERIQCGRGWQSERSAWQEALDWFLNKGQFCEALRS